MSVAARITVVKRNRLHAMLAQINHCNQANRASCGNHNGACFLDATEALPVRHVSLTVKADHLFAFKLKHIYIFEFNIQKTCGFLNTLY